MKHRTAVAVALLAVGLGVGGWLVTRATEPARDASPRGPDPDLWSVGGKPYRLIGGISIAAYDSGDGRALEELFGSHGVEVVIEGSLNYGISVPVKDVERAREILRGTPFAKYIDGLTDHK